MTVGNGQNTGLFWVASILAGTFVSVGTLFPKEANYIMQKMLTFLTTNFGWLYLLLVLGFVVFCLMLAFSRLGRIKLGQDHDQPEYSTFSWLTMLFCAGMGIGLVFWSVAEPISHYSNPPFGKGGTEEAVLTAMRYTFFHWGIHPWAIYGTVGLTLAYFGFRQEKPLLISTTLEPLLGNRGTGLLGRFIDGIAVFATIFGVATSLGLGTIQINSGLHYLFGIPNNLTINFVIVCLVTFLFTLSAISGIGRGIKLLSNINIFLAAVLLIAIFMAGPTRFILNLISITMGSYLQNFLSMSLAFGTFRDPDWVKGWTVFYWAWWIAWAPFVGGFIARISRGRTIREFVLGVLIVPLIFSFLWIGTFGGTALYLEEVRGAGIASKVLNDVASGLYVVLHHYPLAGLFSGIAILLITVFFITSADSATFVVSMFLSGGSLEPKVKTKIFWGVIQGGIALVLLLAGGLKALQTASIVAAFPFMLVMLLMAYSVLSQMRKEVKDQNGGVENV